MSTIARYTILFLLFTSVAWADVPGMRLMGGGEVRYLGLVKVYDARLYTDAQPDKDVLAADVSRCLLLTYAVPLTVQDFVRGAETVLRRQYGAEEIAAVRQGIDTLHRAYQDVGDGDTYALCYNAREHRTTLSLNDRELAAIVSADFARVYFGIWLDEKLPIDDRLRRDLLTATATNQGR